MYVGCAFAMAGDVKATFKTLEGIRVDTVATQVQRCGKRNNAFALSTRTDDHQRVRVEVPLRTV